MINFHVSYLDKLPELLKAGDIKIDESYGKFAWVYDSEGNKIELWQPTMRVS